MTQSCLSDEICIRAPNMSLCPSHVVYMQLCPSHVVYVPGNA
jgi:hypothetical protein